MEELQHGRIGEQALEIWRARLTAAAIWTRSAVAVADGELHQAQPVAMRVEAQRLGVDRDNGASVDPLGEIALMQADGHAARIFRCGADSLSQNAQGLSKRRGGLRPTRSPARRIVLTNGWALVDGPPGPGSNPMRYILALIVVLRNCCAARLRGILKIDRQIRFGRKIGPGDKNRQAQSAERRSRRRRRHPSFGWKRRLLGPLNPQGFGWRSDGAAARPEPTRRYPQTAPLVRRPPSLHSIATQNREERTPVNDPTNGLNGSDRRFNTLVIELAIRLFAIGALIYWTFIIVLPFAAIILWSVVLAVALYPIFRVVAEILGGRPIAAASFDDDRRPRADHRARHLDGRRRHRPHQGGDGGH